MAKRRRVRWDRVFLVFGPIILLILIISVSCRHKKPEEESSSDMPSVSDIAEDTLPVPGIDFLETDDAVTADQTLDHLVICIDAGHGGEDGGATNQDATRFEKDDNLRLALATREAFLKYPNVEVIMTRETDVFIELQERCDIANNANADFFISIHRNSSLSGSGVEIWINNNSGGDNTWDKLIAEYIMDWLNDVGISERRGIKSGFRNSSVNSESNNYYVNRYTNMPSCLIEMGFMTSSSDNRYFDEKLNQYADAIAGAVIELLTDKGLYSAELPQ